jgi:hypothetical protein
MQGFSGINPNFLGLSRKRRRAGEKALLKAGVGSEVANSRFLRPLASDDQLVFA